jgi:carbamate kinase
MIQQSIENALRRAGSAREVVTLITQVQVRADDPALREPTKFIGQVLTAERAEELQREGHVVKLDGRGHPRRVVGSPVPQAIHELNVIKRLVERGTLVIACGGGGAPIYDDPVKGWEGLDAVIDKDLAAAVLARDLGARLLLILTDVDAVYAAWGTPQQRPLRRLTVGEAEAMIGFWVPSTQWSSRRSLCVTAPSRSARASAPPSARIACPAPSHHFIMST